MKNIIGVSQMELFARPSIKSHDSHYLNVKTRRTVSETCLRCHKICKSSRDIATGTHMWAQKKTMISAAEFLRRIRPSLYERGLGSIFRYNITAPDLFEVI